MSRLTDAASVLKNLCEANDIDLTSDEGPESFISETINEVLGGEYDFNEREGAVRLGICCGSLMEISSVTLEEIEKFVIEEII